MKSIEDKINELRTKLVEAVGTKGKFTDEEVVRMSQQLDSYIVELQSRQAAKRRDQ
ncbi:aspartyl-phosphate phosphatase Spo0E family protein [Paenibacillus dendritiformis]|uniref:aspartyl-phosphate phosphatase Spo0E family protein n=1 Tax=Paenibacillus dendritiformis TaxID=130049 RepID=UPI0010595BEB|nr:aspartyl-phosphate phosphatase Spo0E family protein [Paenibacillus dendritiformis]TDL57628.1 aspartyl-phosphate phosphatase Spo0E family protein [Paenibacillus dendritiformis]